MHTANKLRLVVAAGTAAALIGRAPAASPKPDPTVKTEHVALKGDIPSPIAPPSGCVFRTRCPHAIDACAQHVPALEEVAPGRWSACIRKEIVMMKVAA